MKTETINFDTAKGASTAYVAAPDDANAIAGNEPRVVTRDER